MNPRKHTTTIEQPGTSDSVIRQMIRQWGIVYKRIAGNLRRDGHELALMTAAILDTEPVNARMTSSERVRLLVVESGGTLSEHYIQLLALVGRDGDIENALKILFSASSNVMDWLRIPARARVPLMSQPIPVLRYGATTTDEHERVPWDVLTPAQFRRAVDVAGACVVPLDTQLARTGRRPTVASPKWSLLDHGVRMTRRCELSTAEFVEISRELSRTKKFTKPQMTEMIRLLERSLAAAPPVSAHKGGI